MHRAAADPAVRGPIMAHQEMANQEYECPVPRIADVPPGMVAATAKFESVALRWRALAERRCAYFIELYKSGRWRLYYDEPKFIAAMQASEALAVRWVKIAPLPNERAAAEALVSASSAPLPVGSENSNLESMIAEAFSRVAFVKPKTEPATIAVAPKLKREYKVIDKSVGKAG
jgi:uncharacterized repeat protein (TIGR03809 family)